MCDQLPITLMVARPLNTRMNTSLKTALAEWLNDERYTIFATLAFHPNKAPSKEAVIAAGSNVLNRLDHAVLDKRGVKAGLRVPRAAVYQEGARSASARSLVRHLLPDDTIEAHGCLG